MLRYEQFSVLGRIPQILQVQEFELNVKNIQIF